MHKIKCRFTLCYRSFRSRAFDPADYLNSAFLLFSQGQERSAKADAQDFVLFYIGSVQQNGHLQTALIVPYTVYSINTVFIRYNLSKNVISVLKL